MRFLVLRSCPRSSLFPTWPAPPCAPGVPSAPVLIRILSVSGPWSKGESSCRKGPGLLVWVLLAQSLQPSRQREGASRLGQGLPSALPLGPGDTGWAGIPRANGEGRFCGAVPQCSRQTSPGAFATARCAQPQKESWSERGSRSMHLPPYRLLATLTAPNLCREQCFLVYKDHFPALPPSLAFAD